MKKRIISIVGPTAAGKSDLAAVLASFYKGSIISADSVQVYKGLDIISGKDIISKTPFYPLSSSLSDKFQFGYFLQNHIPYYMYDVAEPIEEFSVSVFCSLAKMAVEYSWKKNRLPFIVGGTSFYITSLFDGVKTIYIPPNKALRETLDKKSIEELQNELRKNDKNRFKQMNNSDRHNKRRLIRAIEISEHKKAGKKVELFKGLKHDYEVIEIGLDILRDDIKKRIDARVDARLKEGAIEEAQKLFEIYSVLSPQVKTSNGYKEIFDYLLGRTSLEEAIQRWRESEYLHAKHQMTFLKKRKSIKWFDRLSPGLEDDIKRFLSL